mmetsp:Transcript_16142/g.16274  ORF Transcript_16142/g.16274 Transcript_16142/m.16274 type:complete len:234 (+) Transcript_16142:308-1009(+)
MNQFNAPTQPKRLVKLSSMLYHRRSSDSGQHSSAPLENDVRPIQIIHPSGSIGLGLPLLEMSENEAEDQNLPYRNVVITSGPTNFSSDKSYRQILKLTFIFLFILNLITTILLYNHADTADTSLIQLSTDSPPSVLQKISDKRHPNEFTYFLCTIILLTIGVLSAVCEHVLGLSIFAISICFNFFCGIPNLPYFVYSYRFIIDFVMLYVCLELRSKLMLDFLPIRVYERSNNR